MLTYFNVICETVSHCDLEFASMSSHQLSQIWIWEVFAIFKISIPIPSMFWYIYLHEWLTKMVHVYINIHQSHTILWDWMCLLGLCWHDGVVVGGQSVFWLPPRAPRWQKSAPVGSVDAMGDPVPPWTGKHQRYNLNIEYSKCEYVQYSRWCVLFFCCNVGFSSGELLLLWTTRYFFGGCDLLHHDFVVVIL